MRINFKKGTIKVVAITIIVTFIITVAIIAYAAWKGVNIFVDRTIDRLADVVTEQCEDDPLHYRGEMWFPDDLSCDEPIYDRDLATAIWDAGGLVGSSNCKDEIPIPEPFNRSFKAEGVDPDNGHKTMYGYIFWSDHSDLACFIFAGTYYRHQWRDNLKVNLSFAPELRGSVPDTQIHSGFYHNYLAVRPVLWDWWHEHNGIKKLIIGGRSLGGALSTICAYDFALLPGVEILHYSFAAPRVGNVTFADKFNERVPNSVRVYNTEDIVTDLPPAIFRSNVYKHVGTPIHTKSFTENMGSLVDNHIEAYRSLPD